MPMKFGTTSISSIYKGDTKIDKIYKGFELVYQSSLLPSGYIELDYIESDGNQYIDTGIKPDNTTGFKVKLAVDDTQSDVYYLGAREDTGDTRFGLGIYQGHFYLGFGTYFSDATNWTISSMGVFEANLNYKESGTGDINGTYPKNITGTLEGATFTRNIYLFKFNYSGASVPTSLSRIYKFVITKGSDVVANFIPCLDDQGVPCLYDIVGKEAYYNAGTGQFKYHYVPPIVLPTGYTQLEWIKSDGNQYIDTGYYPSQKTKITCDFMPDEQNSNLLNYVYGTYTQYQACGLYMSYSANVYGVLYGRTDTNTNISRQWGVKAHSVLSSSGLTINDSTYNISTSVYTAPKSLYLFKGNGSTRPGMIGKIYSFLIEEWGYVIQYLVPCLDANGEPCMYDLVGKQTYYNLGTGRFSYNYQEVLPDGYTRVNWIRCSNNQSSLDSPPKPRIEIPFNFDNTMTLRWIESTEGQANTLGIYNGTTRISYISPWSSSNKIGFNYNGSVTRLQDPTPVADKVYDLRLAPDGGYVDGTKITESNVVTYPAGTKIVNCLYSNNWYVNRSKNYLIQVLGSNNEILLNAVPCLDDNGVPCLYDTVSETTIYKAPSNANDFLYG